MSLPPLLGRGESALTARERGVCAHCWGEVSLFGLGEVSLPLPSLLGRGESALTAQLPMRATCLAGPQRRNPSCRSRVCTAASLYTVQCTLYTVHCILCSVHCTLHSLHCILCTTNCKLYAVYCTLQASHCTLHTSHCTLHYAYQTHYRPTLPHSPSTLVPWYWWPWGCLRVSPSAWASNIRLYCSITQVIKCCTHAVSYCRPIVVKFIIATFFSCCKRRATLSDYSSKVWI